MRERGEDSFISGDGQSPLAMWEGNGTGTGWGCSYGGLGWGDGYGDFDGDSAEPYSYEEEVEDD